MKCGNYNFCLIYFDRLAVFLVVVTVVVRIKYIILETQIVISQGADVMGFNEPLLVIVFGDQLLDLLVIMLCRHGHFIRSGNVVIQQFIIALYYSEL